MTRSSDFRRYIAVEGELGGFEVLDDEAKRFIALEGALGGFAVLATAEADHDKPPFADRYSPDQPRVPGGPEGGQWTKGGGGVVMDPSTESLPVEIKGKIKNTLDRLTQEFAPLDEAWSGPLRVTTEMPPGWGWDEKALAQTGSHVIHIQPWAIAESMFPDGVERTITHEFGHDVEQALSELSERERASDYPHSATNPRKWRDLHAFVRTFADKAATPSASHHSGQDRERENFAEWFSVAFSGPGSNNPQHGTATARSLRSAFAKIGVTVARSTQNRIICPDCGDWACARHGGHIGERCDCWPCDDCGDLFPPNQLDQEHGLCPDCRSTARAADDDDHYYGAWSGGKKSEGGHPEGEGTGDQGDVISFNEAEARIVAAGFTRADIRELDPALRLEVTEELERLARAYPAIMENNFIGIEVGACEQNAYAQTTGTFGSHAITLSTAWWGTGPGIDDGTSTTVPPGGKAGTLRATLEMENHKGWSSTATPAGTVAHEFGHIVDRYVGQQSTGATYVTNGMLPGMKYADQGRWQRSTVSRYAQTNASEWFSEVFSARECGARGGDYEWPDWMTLAMKKAGVKP